MTRWALCRGKKAGVMRVNVKEDKSAGMKGIWDVRKLGSTASSPAIG